MPSRDTAVPSLSTLERQRWPWPWLSRRHGVDEELSPLEPLCLRRQLFHVCPPCERSAASRHLLVWHDSGQQTRKFPNGLAETRAKRRAAYSRIQALYKKSRTSCAPTILSGQWHEVAPSLELREQVAYWKDLFETKSQNDSREPPAEGPPEWEIVAPVTTEEVKRHIRGIKDDAAGPDGNPRKDLRRLTAGALATRYNLWLLADMAPDAFRGGVMVLIPKSADTTLPQNHRPITLGPILCRLYHRVLAGRIEMHYRISERQKAFRRGDGLAENCYILRTVIDDRKTRCQATNIAFIDVSKAFQYTMDCVYVSELTDSSVTKLPWTEVCVKEILSAQFCSMPLSTLRYGTWTRKLSEGWLRETLVPGVCGWFDPAG